MSIKSVLWLIGNRDTRGLENVLEIRICLQHYNTCKLLNDYYLIDNKNFETEKSICVFYFIKRQTQKTYNFIATYKRKNTYKDYKIYWNISYIIKTFC